MSEALKPVVVTRAEGSDGPLSRELRGLALTTFRLLQTRAS